MAATEQPDQQSQPDLDRPEVDDHAAVEPEQTRATTAIRTVVASAAVLTVLLLGAAIGVVVVGFLGPGSQHATPQANSADVGFAQDMSVHHRQAVEMAGWLRDHSADPVIRQLTFDIESAQLDQIGRMEGWLTLWGQPELPPSGKFMGWMAGHNHGGASGPVPAGVNPMPGMATPEEIAKLRSLSGTELDVYFLQLMIRHHSGGTPMAQYAADHASEPAVRTLANNMVKWQSSELQTMNTLLTARGGAPLPAQK